MAVSFQGLRTTTFVGGRRRRHELGGMNPQESRWKRRFRTRRTPAAFPSRAAAHSAIMPVCSMMNIVFVSAEVAPWSKTGGLGDVLSGLPPALAALGHRVMTISPRYDQYKDAWDTDVTIEVTVADQKETIRFFHCFKRGVDRVFVDHPRFLAKVRGKTRSKIYGPTTGVDYYDNQFRFCLLAKAAIEAVRILNLNSGTGFSGPYGD
jgi:granule-bound starch synthase